jgi:hypothetical protein
MECELEVPNVHWKAKIHQPEPPSNCGIIEIGLAKTSGIMSPGYGTIEILAACRLSR